jgi:hypothetical protein
MFYTIQEHECCQYVLVGGHEIRAKFTIMIARSYDWCRLKQDTVPRGHSDRSQAQIRAERALTEALMSATPGARVVRGRVERFEDNLLPGVEARQFERDLRGGAGDELRDKFRAPYSSSALVVNSFARFKELESKDLESDLRVDRRDGFRSICFEQQFATGLRGTPPHLDIVLAGPDHTLAIESKCTEHLGKKVPSFKDSYERLRKSDRQSKPWLDEMIAIRTGGRRYGHLDAAQLIKHAFGLANNFESGSATLIYLYWEPKNAADVRELAVHRRELEAFEKRVAGGSPRFRAISYRQLWQQWAKMDRPAWLRTHVSNLRKRYEVEI